MLTAQAILGHERLDMALGYARLYDRTLAEDYDAAMEQVEKCLEAELPKRKGDASLRRKDGEHAELLALATQLAEPGLGIEVNLDLVDPVCRVLNYRMLPEEKQHSDNSEG